MYTILAVDDAKDTLMLLEFDLAEEGYQVLTADSGHSALAILAQTEVDLILLDMYMPEMSGLELLETLKKQEATANIPVIMLSASYEDDQIVSALELGADDYVTKPYIAKVLLARMSKSFRLLEKTLALEALAKTDFLTSVNNRGCFETEAAKLINQAQRANNELVIVMLDIDFFKQVNDQYGHESGDKVLITFAQLIKDCFRDYDLIGRIGGEEFAVCMPNTCIDNAIIACERLREKVKQQRFPKPDDENHFFSISVSIGVASGYGSSLHFESLLRKADSGLYYAKRNGRDRTINANNLDNGTLLDGNPSLTPLEQGEQIAPLGEASLPIDALVTGGSNNNGTESLADSSVAVDEKYPGIDYEIGVANVLNDDALFQDILLMFYQDHSQDDQKLAQAIQASDLATLKHLVHTLKGVACSIGAMAMFERAKALDIAVNEDQEQLFEPLLAPLSAELSKVVTGLEVALADKLT